MIGSRSGNPVWCNLPRKFNIAVSGSRDDFAHTHINDIGFQPAVHASTGEMGFNVVLGGYMSIKRVAESIDMNLWVPADVDAVVDLATVSSSPSGCANLAPCLDAQARPAG